MSPSNAISASAMHLLNLWCYTKPTLPATVLDAGYCYSCICLFIAQSVCLSVSVSVTAVKTTEPIEKSSTDDRLTWAQKTIYYMGHQPNVTEQSVLGRNAGCYYCYCSQLLLLLLCPTKLNQSTDSGHYRGHQYVCDLCQTAVKTKAVNLVINVMCLKNHKIQISPSLVSQTSSQGLQHRDDALPIMQQKHHNHNKNNTLQLLTDWSADRLVTFVQWHK